jgi:hypothetical protein
MLAGQRREKAEPDCYMALNQATLKQVDACD